MSEPTKKMRALNTAEQAKLNEINSRIQIINDQIATSQANIKKLNEDQLDGYNFKIGAFRESIDKLKDEKDTLTKARNKLLYE